MPLRRFVAALLAVLVLGGCAQVVPGHPAGLVGPITAPAVAPDAVGIDPLGIDPTAIGPATAARLQQFWRAAFPAAFGRGWRDVTRFVPVHRGDPPPPCVGSAADVAGQAYYCPTADAVVWDADGLVPRLLRSSGVAGVLVVLAHEVGHAVQTRLGVDGEQARDPARYPTILLEAMADCYAGFAVATLGAVDRDTSLQTLAGFRDPLGIEPGDAQAHGNAFDRVGSFQIGYDDGATACAGMTAANRPFTERAFGSSTDRAQGGNLPLDTLLDALGADARSWFGGLSGRPAPPLRMSTRPAGCPTWAQQGPAAYCAAEPAVVVDRAQLAGVEGEIGDYAAGTLVASRYGLATLDALGRPVVGPAAGLAAICLAGAYTARLVHPRGSFSLSPGDLDEAVQVLLTDDWAGRDAEGRADPATDGYARVDRFRAGVLGGAGACPGARP